MKSFVAFILGAVALVSAANIKPVDENLPVAEESKSSPVDSQEEANNIHHSPSHDEHEHIHHQEFHSIHHSHPYPGHSGHSHDDHSESESLHDHSYQHTHDVTTHGEHNEQDTMVFSGFVYKQPAANESVEIVKTYNVDSVNHTRTITHFDVYNRLDDEFTSTADLVSGGPGFGHVTLVFKNQVGRPVFYKTVIHAKTNETQ